MSDRQTANTRQRLVETAADLFYRQGYTATGVAQILREAEVHSGSLYHCFASKEELLVAVLERYRELLWPEVLDPVFGHTDDPIERIFGVLDGYRQMLLLTGCGGGCPIGNLALELADPSPRVRALLVGNFEGWRQAIEGCVRAAAQSGRLPDDVDAEALSTFVLTAMEGGIMQARTHRSTRPFEASMTMLRDYFDRLSAG